MMSTTLTPHRRVRVVGTTPEHDPLRTVPEQLDRGRVELIDLQPDGNSFAFVAGFIKTKGSARRRGEATRSFRDLINGDDGHHVYDVALRSGCYNSRRNSRDMPRCFCASLSGHGRGACVRMDRSKCRTPKLSARMAGKSVMQRRTGRRSPRASRMNTAPG